MRSELYKKVRTFVASASSQQKIGFCHCAFSPLPVPITAQIVIFLLSHAACWCRKPALHISWQATCQYLHLPSVKTQAASPRRWPLACSVCWTTTTTKKVWYYCWLLIWNSLPLGERLACLIREGCSWDCNQMDLAGWVVGGDKQRRIEIQQVKLTESTRDQSRQIRGRCNWQLILHGTPDLCCFVSVSLFAHILSNLQMHV